MTLGLVAVALADVANYPESCPPGAIGRASHSPYCEPEACDPATCTEACRPAGLCVEVTTTEYGSVRRDARSTCERQEDCPTAATCEIEDRCVPSEDTGAAIAGCRCDSVAAAPWVAFGIGLAALAARRRSRRATR